MSTNERTQRTNGRVRLDGVCVETEQYKQLHRENVTTSFWLHFYWSNRIKASASPDASAPLAPPLMQHSTAYSYR